MISSFNEDPEHNTYPQLIGFYLATRILTAFHFATSYFLLPAVRGFMVASCLHALTPIGLWVGSIYVDMPNRLALIWIAIAIDMWGQAFYFVPMQMLIGRDDESDTALSRTAKRLFDYYPAVNIEHRVERMNAFVSLVLGYSVVGILFQSNGGYNINSFLGKAILGLMQAYFFNWIYFDVDGHGIDVHAIRRSSVTSKSTLVDTRSLLVNHNTILTFYSDHLEQRSFAIHHGLHCRLVCALPTRTGSRHAKHAP